MNKHDPRLTSFVLGELETAEAAQVARAVEASTELQTGCRGDSTGGVLVESGVR